MQRILKRISEGPLLLAGLLSLAIIISIWIWRSPKPTKPVYLFEGSWDINEVQQLFTGKIPDSAKNVSYTPLANYGLLEFDAPPADALAFANRFCYGMLFEGYDPFNATDNNENKGILIQTRFDYFYYSYSLDSKMKLGNRCSDTRRGGDHQILVDKRNPDTYHIQLEISSGCNNRNAPHPCEGTLIKYADRGVMKPNASYMVTSKLAQGDQWEVPVIYQKRYQITVNLQSPYESQERYDFALQIIPKLINTGNEPDCPSCWASVFWSIKEKPIVSFSGDISQFAYIEIFWKSDNKQYQINISEAD